MLNIPKTCKFALAFGSRTYGLAGIAIGLMAYSVTFGWLWSYVWFNFYFEKKAKWQFPLAAVAMALIAFALFCLISYLLGGSILGLGSNRNLAEPLMYALIIQIVLILISWMLGKRLMERRSQ